MRSFIVFAFLSFSAFASDCFIREDELVTKDVTIPKEICFEEPVIKLVVLGKSRAQIKYTLDGEAAMKEVTLDRPVERQDGRLSFYVDEIQSDFLGGWCSDMTVSQTDLSFSLNRDGTDLKIDEVKASVSSTPDNCHRGMSVIQEIIFKRK
jgi:hypothetical protein